MKKNSRKMINLGLLSGILVLSACVHKRDNNTQSQVSPSNTDLNCGNLGDQTIISQCHINEINRKIADCESQGDLYIWENGSCHKKD